MPKCKFCGDTIAFVTKNDNRPVAVVPGGVKRFLYQGEIVKGQEIHTCPDYEKQHKRRETVEKYRRKDQD